MTQRPQMCCWFMNVLLWCYFRTLPSSVCGRSVSRGSSTSCVWPGSDLAGRLQASLRFGPAYRTKHARWSSSMSTRRRSRHYWLRREREKDTDSDMVWQTEHTQLFVRGLSESEWDSMCEDVEGELQWNFRSFFSSQEQVNQVSEAVKMVDCNQEEPDRPLINLKWTEIQAAAQNIEKVL